MSIRYVKCIASALCKTVTSLVCNVRLSHHWDVISTGTLLPHCVILNSLVHYGKLTLWVHYETAPVHRVRLGHSVRGKDTDYRLVHVVSVCRCAGISVARQEKCCEWWTAAPTASTTSSSKSPSYSLSLSLSLYLSPFIPLPLSPSLYPPPFIPLPLSPSLYPLPLSPPFIPSLYPLPLSLSLFLYFSPSSFISLPLPLSPSLYPSPFIPLPLPLSLFLFLYFSPSSCISLPLTLPLHKYKQYWIFDPWHMFQLHCVQHRPNHRGHCHRSCLLPHPVQRVVRLHSLCHHGPLPRWVQTCHQGPVSQCSNLY